MKKIIIALALFPTLTLAAFSDVGSNHIFGTAIDYAKNNNIVKGYNDGTFGPDRTINRAEFTKILLESTNKAPNNCTPTKQFSDVSNDAWFAPYVCEAVNRNIIKGYDDNTFRPGAPINFVEAAKIVALSFGQTNQTANPWYKPYVEFLEDKAASPDTISSIDKSLTRGELAEIVFRLKTNNTAKTRTAFFRATPSPVVSEALAKVITPEQQAIIEEFTSPEKTEGKTEEELAALEEEMLDKLGGELPETTVEEAMPESVTFSSALIESGTFQAAGSKSGSGSAKIFTQEDGSHLLRLENFSVSNGPDLYVTLVKNANPKKGKDVKAGYESLGLLKATNGNQNYEIPANIDLSQYNSVVIYCRAFSVVFSVASL